MRLLLVLLFLWLSLHTNAQTNTPIDPKHFDYQLLENLVFDKINALRVEKRCPALEKDSSLFLAAKFHADYMVKKKVLSHNETGNSTMSSPKKRAAFFGCKSNGIGENIQFTYYNNTVDCSKRRRFQTDSYEVLADAIVYSWVTSSGHYQNIILPQYKKTGIAVSINPETEQVYICQDFAY